MPGPKNRTLEAFKENFNTIGLATVAAISAATLNPLPLLAGLVIEAAYLLFVPDSKWYDARLSERYDQEVVERRQRLKTEVFPSLGANAQARFNRLEGVRNAIGAQKFEGKRWFREVLRKLDYLLEKFLLFASKEVQFRQYLHSVQEEVKGAGKPAPPPVVDRKKAHRREAAPVPEGDDRWVRRTVEGIQEAYVKEIEELDELLQSDENLHNQAVLQKRKEVLMRRSLHVGRIGESLTNLQHQIHLIEDTFGLINDEIRARSPEQVLADIEEVVSQTDRLSESLQDVAPFETMPVEPGAERLYGVER